MSLTASTRSETVKVFTTAGWWILALILVVYLGSTAAGLGALYGAVATGQLGEAGIGGVPPDLPLTLYSLATSVGYVFPLLLGTLVVTNEFRHKTLTPTFLATPRRGTVLTAKVLVAILAGVLFAALAIVATVGPAAGFLAGFGLDAALGDAETWALLGRSAIALVLWAVVGVGLGALVRNQVVAIVIVLAFTQFVEPIARFAGAMVDGLAEVVPYLPGAASDALVGASFYTSIGGATGAALDWWVGGIVLAAYALVLLVLGAATSWRRDVT